MKFNLHLIDSTGRHYVYDLTQQTLEIYVNKDPFIFPAGHNNVQQKFLELYQEVLIEKKALCVLTPESCVMLHADQIVGAQLLPREC